MRNTRTGGARGLVHGSRGAGSVEYVTVLALVAIASFGAWTALGEATSERANCVASALGGGAGPCGVGGGDDGLLRYGHAPPGSHNDDGSPPILAIARNGQPGYLSEGRARGATERPVQGRLFIPGKRDGDAIAGNDVKQGSLEDCYLLASLAALAEARPAAIRDRLRDNGDGTYTVTFTDTQCNTSGLCGEITDSVTVDANMLIAKDGTAVYAKSGDYEPPGTGARTRQGSHELWPMIIEKAYAVWKGGYDRIGARGRPEEVLEALTGNPARTQGGTVADSQALWGPSLNEMREQLYDRGMAIVLGTRNDQGHLFRNGTLLTSHSYYVKRVGSGTITLGNVWGWGDHREEITLGAVDLHRYFNSATFVSPRPPRR